MVFEEALHYDDSYFKPEVLRQSHNIEENYYKPVVGHSIVKLLHMTASRYNTDKWAIKVNATVCFVLFLFHLPKFKGSLGEIPCNICII